MTFTERVLESVRRIPAGKVASYGQIAALAGSPRAAITVGQILHRQLGLGVTQRGHGTTQQGRTVLPCWVVPWQRVINSQGYVSTTCLEHPAELQAALLKTDGVTVTRHRGLYRVDLRRFLWQT